MTTQSLLTSWSLLIELGKKGLGLDNIRGILPAAGLKFQLPLSSPSFPTAATVETCPLRGLLGCLPDTPVSQPSLATIPNDRSSSSGSPGDTAQGSPLPISEYNPEEARLRPWSQEDQTSSCLHFL